MRIAKFGIKSFLISMLARGIIDKTISHESPSGNTGQCSSSTVASSKKKKKKKDSVDITNEQQVAEKWAVAGKKEKREERKRKEKKFHHRHNHTIPWSRLSDPRVLPARSIH